MNRLKATMLCTFSFARGRLIGLAIIQMIMMALTLIFSEVIKRFDVLVCADILAVIHLFVFGIVFYGRHNAFCISNAVSLKYRIYSFSAAAGGMCLIAALLTSVIYGYTGASTNYSFAEIYRYIIIGGAAQQNFLIASFFENLFYYISAVSFGSLIGSLRSAKGDGFALLMLAVSAAAVFGFSFLGRYFVTPAVWLCVIPAVMLQSRFTAILLYIIIAAASLFAAYLLTYGVQSGTRRKNMKRNKFICFIMAIAMSAFLCGCDKRDLPDDIENQLSTALFINADGFISYARVKGKYKEFAESCFDDIEIYGAKFALPMNVSDLPEGFTVDEGQSPKSYYNGYKTANVKLYFEGVTAASAEIMYPANSSQSEGQIVTLSFTEFLLNTEAPFRMGGEFGYLSMNRAAELLGECEKRGYMIYALGNDRTIRFDYFNTDENSSDCNAFSVTLTTADMGVN